MEQMVSGYNLPAQELIQLPKHVSKTRLCCGVHTDTSATSHFSLGFPLHQEGHKLCSAINMYEMFSSKIGRWSRIRQYVYIAEMYHTWRKPGNCANRNDNCSTPSQRWACIWSMNLMQKMAKDWLEHILVLESLAITTRILGGALLWNAHLLVTFFLMLNART